MCVKSYAGETLTAFNLRVGVALGLYPGCLVSGGITSSVREVQKRANPSA